jgi:hypothetical protein
MSGATFAVNVMMRAPKGGLISAVDDDAETRHGRQRGKLPPQVVGDTLHTHGLVVGALRRFHRLSLNVVQNMLPDLYEFHALRAQAEA